ncbi:MAG TPA: glutathione S-transferase family protein, partial [Rubellimicrobium sp.]|nr:glutathione S-transferase family protein [Rubellimicrobium sp.]
VERVALALAHKELQAEPVLVDPADRGRIRELTGQDFVPVLEHDGEVIWDSPRILAHLESAFPEAPLLPAERARRQEILVFCDWFNRVWKLAPNRLAADGLKPGLAAELRGSLDRFEDLLDGRDFLFGSKMTLADVTAFPFLKYGWVHDPEDDEPFHQVLAEHLALDPGHAALRIWIERMDGQPRAGISATATKSARSGA